MKKLFYVLYAFNLICIAAIAGNDNKPSIIVAPFSYVKGTINESDLRRIEAQVENTVNESKRFNVVNRSDMVALDNERVKMKGEDFIDGRYIEQGKKIGAQFMIFGRINTTSCKPDGGNTSNNIAIINFTIKIVDVENTSEIANNVFESGSGKSIAQNRNATKSASKVFDRFAGTNTSSAVRDADAALARTPELAMTRAIENIDDQLRDFIIEKFPVKFPLADVVDKSDDKVKAILILAGKIDGVKEKDNLSIIETIETEVEGKKYSRSVEIAKLEIVKFEGDFCRCAVRSGGTELMKKLEAKAKLKAITVNKS